MCCSIHDCVGLSVGNFFGSNGVRKKDYMTNSDYSVWSDGTNGTNGTNGTKGKVKLELFTYIEINFLSGMRKAMKCPQTLIWELKLFSHFC